MKLVLLFFLSLSCFGTDVALTIGIGKKTSTASAAGQTVEAKSTTSVMLTPGGDFVNVGLAAVGWEIPVAFGGPARALISNGRVATEKMDFMLVPGARVRIAPVARLSPWASFGVGVGRFNRASVTTLSGLLSAATETSFALAVGVGADFRVAGPLFLRAEGRNFNYKSLEDVRKNSFQFLAGVGLRF
jgi:opacity protein-like surface antigen